MRDEQARYYPGMHLRPKCSSTLVLLIVHVDDLKPAINQRVEKIWRSVKFDSRVITR